MDKSVNLTKHSVLQNVPEMLVICQPLLQHLNITYFNHIRQFPDNTRICLTNHGDWVEHVCHKKLYLVAPFEESKMKHQPGYVLWGGYKENLVYKSAFTYFNIDHSITIIEKCETHTDFYHFGTPADLQINSDYCLHLLDTLKMFILYYKEKAHKLITHSDRLHFPELQSITAEAKKTSEIVFPSKQQKQAFLDDLKIQRFYLGGELENQYLTARELECVRWLVMGKSAEEIAMILDITPRTAIAHINNIKEKFGCIKVSQLVFKLAHSQAAELIFTEQSNASESR